jgi:hypothetical protein
MANVTENLQLTLSKYKTLSKLLFADFAKFRLTYKLLGNTVYHSSLFLCTCELHRTNYKNSIISYFHLNIFRVDVISSVNIEIRTSLVTYVLQIYQPDLHNSNNCLIFFVRSVYKRLPNIYSPCDRIWMFTLCKSILLLVLFLQSVGLAESRLMNCSLPRLIVLTPRLVPPFNSRGATRHTAWETSISERRNYGQEMDDQI